jgi:hypothetical protein
MNNWKNKIAVGLLVAISFAGCQKLTDLNDDPNRIKQSNTAFLLTSSEKQFMDDTWDQWMNGRFGMLYSQYWAQNAYTNESRYQIRTGTNNTYWITFFAGDATTGGGIANLQEIIRVCTETPTFVENTGGNPNNQIQVARVLRAWMFQYLTDVYGSIPYTQALQGNKVVFPKYDTQRDIYIDLLKELTDASAKMDATKGSFTSGDVIYGGNVAKWKKFANSLKLRIAIRMSDKEPALAKAAAEEAIRNGVFTSNSDNALFNYLGATPNNNPLNEDRKTRQDFAMSNVFIDTLKGLSDPRIAKYAAERLNGGGFVGKTYGLSDAGAAAQPNGDVSQPSDAVLAPTAAGVFMDFAEVSFLLAEAAERGMTVPTTAEVSYYTGIAASMSRWGVDVTTATTYMQQQNVSYTSPGSGTDWRHKIGVQKWIALYMRGVEGWTEWRRLDFGVFKMPAAGIKASAKSMVIPTRYLYPTDEANLNGTNYATAVSAQGPDRQDTKLWWDR